MTVFNKFLFLSVAYLFILRYEEVTRIIDNNGR